MTTDTQPGGGGPGRATRESPATAPTAAPRTPGGSAHHVQVVDGLRGLAIVLVLLFHYWQISWWVIPIPGLPRKYNLEFVQCAGFLGVELFFFISAFCLFYPHAKAMFGQGSVPTLKHFYYRRAIKIIPSYWLVLFVFGVFFSSLYPSSSQHGILGDLGLHLIFLHNLTPQTLGSFDGVLWSLAVEVQFYYVFPLLAWAFRRQPWLTTAGMVAIAIAFRAWIRDKPLGSFGQWGDQLPAFLDLFAFGMLAAYLLLWIRQRDAAAVRMRYVFTAVAIAGFVVLALMFRWLYNVRFPGVQIQPWQSVNRQYFGVLFLCITIGSSFAIGLWRRIVANRVLLFLSTISYNLYLWHQAIAALMRQHNWWTSSDDPPMSDPTWRWSFWVVAVIASVAVASLITYGFERPLLRLGVRGAAGALLARLAAVHLAPTRFAGRPAPQTPAADRAAQSPADLLLEADVSTEPVLGAEEAVDPPTPSEADLSPR